METISATKEDIARIEKKLDEISRDLQSIIKFLQRSPIFGVPGMSNKQQEDLAAATVLRLNNRKKSRKRNQKNDFTG